MLMLRLRLSAVELRRTFLSAHSTVAPQAPPPACEAVSALVEFIGASRRLLVLTGAGTSTESGLPDYRSPMGAYSQPGFKPITHQQFLSGHAARQRYWARSFVGWARFRGAQPNAAHVALARLQASGRLAGLITQNVDRLLQAAGAGDVLELHGTTHMVLCLGCGAQSSREELQTLLHELNPGFLAAQSSGVQQQRPDGDTEVGGTGSFGVPCCALCQGILKPDVVFFGDNLKPDVAAQARALAAEADALLVVGSTLSTRSSLRIAEELAARRKPIALLNIGETRADGIASLKVHARAGEALPRALAAGALDPRWHS